MKISNFFLLSYVGTICLTAHGQAFHRCSVNGEIKYQQIPCLEAGIIVGEEIKIKQALKAEEEQRKFEENQKKLEEAKALRIEAEQKEIKEAKEKQMRQENFDRETQKIFDDIKTRFDKHCNGKAIDTLRIGLTESQVLNCSFYQNPDSVNITNTVNGTTKQYVFRLYGKGSKANYLYFKNGILTSFQE